MDFKAIARKKVLGVPVIYLALAAVSVLAYYAWKLKPATAPSSDEPADTNDAGAEPGSGSDLSALNTTGTVVVQPTLNPVADTVEETNEKWLQSAIDYVVTEKKMTTYGTALEALSKYLDGDDLSFEEGQIRDAAIGKLKLPPEGTAKVGKTGTAPAQKQFSTFPGKHIVKGSNDNTPAKIAQLYYGNADVLHVNKIVAENFRLGEATTTYPVGTSLYIARWVNPSYYTSNSSARSANLIGAKNGISGEAVAALNPTLSFPVASGVKVRVH